MIDDDFDEWVPPASWSRTRIRLVNAWWFIKGVWWRGQLRCPALRHAGRSSTLVLAAAHSVPWCRARSRAAVTVRLPRAFRRGRPEPAPRSLILAYAVGALIAAIAAVVVVAAVVGGLR